MAKFYLGQRVRLVAGRSVKSRPFVGSDFVVDGVGPDLTDSDGEPCDFWITGTAKFAVMVWQIEPITPPHVAGSWEVIEQLLPNIREGVAA